MSATDLNQKTCEPCKGGIAPMAIKDARAMMPSLHKDWQLDSTNGTLTRRLEFKGFAKAVYAANLAAYLGDAEGHHPDIAFGWGYCQVVFTTHDAHGLTQNDFICAAKFDAMLAAA